MISIMKESRHPKKRRSGRDFLRRGIIFLIWILIWQGISMLADNALLVASPVESLKALYGLLWEKEFWLSCLASMARIGAGFLTGSGFALFLAILSSKVPLAEEFLRPFMNFCKTVPVAVFTVLILIWWGSSALTAIICFLVVMPNLYLNTLAGIKAVNVKMLEVAKVFGMPLGTKLFYIYRPALKPFVESAMELSLGMCWKSGVAAEVIGTPLHSIGGELYLSKIYLDTPGIFAWSAVIIVCSALFEKVIKELIGLFWNCSPSCEACHSGSREALRGRKKESKERREEGEEVRGDSRERGKKREEIRKNQTVMRKKTGERKTELKERRKEQDFNGRSEKKAAEEQGVNQVMFLQVTGLSKSFGKQQVLKEFTCTYPSGKITYLTGASGSGKTTLFRCLCGLETYEEGKVTEGLTYSVQFQEDRLCEEESPVKNLEMVMGSSKARKEGEKILLSLGLPWEALDKPCRELSGGMKRRVSLARAMEANSDCVLLDEPYTGMDECTRRNAENYIKKRMENRIVLMATHI